MGIEVLGAGVGHRNRVIAVPNRVMTAQNRVVTAQNRVMTGLGPATHDFTSIKPRKSWMAGTRPAMTRGQMRAAVPGSPMARGQKGAGRPSEFVIAAVTRESHP